MSKGVDELPLQIGPYRVIKRVGSGGMGDVYRAVHNQLKREVALKVLKPSIARDDRVLKRFLNEARAAAIPNHENIVIFYENGEDGDFKYLALEYVHGKDLMYLLDQRGKLPIAFCLNVIKQAAKALEHAYKHGIVHRDIKPSNFLITKKDKIVKLTDMGLARQIEEMEDTKITRDGYTLGTVDYMAPEQAKDSHAADIRSDIYSLGCTWYHLLAGKVPYSGAKVVDKLYKHAHERIPDIRDAVPDVPDEMAYVIERMMKKEPEDRYQTPTELLDDLNRLDTRRSEADVAALALLAQEEELGDSGAAEPEAAAARSGRPTRPLTRSRKTLDDELPEEVLLDEAKKLTTQKAISEHKRGLKPILQQQWSLFVVGCVVGLLMLGALFLMQRGRTTQVETPEQNTSAAKEGAEASRRSELSDSEPKRVQSSLGNREPQSSTEALPAKQAPAKSADPPLTGEEGGGRSSRQRQEGSKGSSTPAPERSRRS